MADIEEGAGEPIDWSRHPWEARLLAARLTLLVVSTLSVFALGAALLVATQAKEATEFSMELSASEGLNLNATTSETTLLSPAFRLKLHVENARLLQRWCSNGGEVAVTYSGVALAWGHVPRFCVERRAPAELALLPWGREVGLSEDVRRRLVSELHGGTAQVTVEMKLFYDATDWSSPKIYRWRSLHLFQLSLGNTERRNN